MKKLSVLFIGIVLMAIPVRGQGNIIPDSIRQLLTAATAQTYETQMSLSMEGAQNYAIQQNRSLQNASLEVKKAHAQRWQTIAAMLPQADGSIGKNVMYDDDWNEKKIQLNPLQDPMSMSPWSYGVTVSMGLNGQAIIGALLNNIAIEMQDITREKTEDDLRASVTKSYVAVLVMEDIIQLLDSSLVNVEKLAQQTQCMAEVGSVEQTQADQIFVKVNTLRNQVNATKRNLQLSYNALRVLLNIEPNVELQLTTNLDQVLSSEKTLTLLLEDFTMDNNYNYQLLSKNVELAKKNVQMAGWAYGPTVSAFYKYNYQDYGKDGGFTMMSSPNTVGFSVAVPIWSSGKRAAGVTEKKIALQEAQNTFNETTDNLKIQYSQLRYNLVNSYETYMTEHENIMVTTRVLQNVANKYNWGAASSLELTNASNDLISAQSSYVNAVMELVNAQVELDNFLNNKK